MKSSGSDGLRSLALATRARSIEKTRIQNNSQIITHPDHDAVLSLKFGYVFVPPRHLRAIQWPETAHNFNGALRRVRHLHPVTESREHRPEQTQRHGYRHGQRGGDTALLQSPGLGRVFFPARVTTERAALEDHPSSSAMTSLHPRHRHGD